MTAPLSVPLPVLTTHRPDRRDRGYLAWVAIAQEIAHLPLETAPIDSTPHALEIHVDGFDTPLVVLADPVGPPTEQGFPLRLKPIDEAHEAELRFELFGGDAPPPAPATTREEPAEDPRKLHYLTPIQAFELPAKKKHNSTIPPSLSANHAKALSRPPSARPPMTFSRRAPGALTGRTLGDGRFQLERLLGGGASGEVYRALHSALRRAVAVKVLHPQLQQSHDYCKRFYGEALAASRLDHRNVLRVIDYGQDPDGLLYIVMELLEGESVQQILDVQGALPLERIVHLITQACAGLAHAHESGVIHRDIKPENIVVVKRRDDDGRETDLVKVCDFGIAHWQPVSSAAAAAQSYEEDSTIIDRPDASEIVGTPIYMAPEQIRNEHVDARTDVYALGVVLYELATGRVPFVSDSPMEILTKHLTEEPPPPSVHDPRIDPDLERIILKALQKDPAKRHRDTRELRVELRQLVSEDLSQPSGLHKRVTVRTPLTTASFLSNPAGTLAELRDIDDRLRTFGYSTLAESIKLAFTTGKRSIGLELVAWLDARLGDPGVSVEERDDAQRARHVVRDADVVRALVGQLLDVKPEQRDELLRLLASAAPVAAHAMIEMRRQRMTSLELRGQFVALLRALGAAALPSILSALEPLVPLTTRQDEALAEDLLRAIPDSPSEPAGEVTVRFVRIDKPALGVAALRATAMLWGVRARPLLVGVLDANVDAFRLVGIEALQRLGGMDDGALERLARIVAAPSTPTDDVRLAAAAAFASALPESRSRAIWFLHQRLNPQHGFMSSLRKAIGGPRENPRVLGALARSLAVLDPSGARPILERLAASNPEVRPQIEAILAGR